MIKNYIKLYINYNNLCYSYFTNVCIFEKHNKILIKNIKIRRKHQEALYYMFIERKKICFPRKMHIKALNHEKNLVQVGIH